MWYKRNFIKYKIVKDLEDLHFIGLTFIEWSP